MPNYIEQYYQEIESGNITVTSKRVRETISETRSDMNMTTRNINLMKLNLIEQYNL